MEDQARRSVDCDSELDPMIQKTRNLGFEDKDA